MTDDAFDAILSFVEDELSFATSHYNDSYLDRRISSRIRRTRSSDYADYFDLLREDPDEQQALVQSMSINVTGFFRNPDVWEGIRTVLREIADETGETGETGGTGGTGGTNEADEIRIWSAACADGREPYSLSMLVHDDPAIDASSVRILGTDISKPALETARSGVYEASRTVDVGEQLSFLDDPDEYVAVDDRTYRIADRVKRLVEFERHDLINDDPKSGFDLVVCRNLFIYIDNAYKASMLESIADSMRPGGTLVIGKAETIPPTLKSAFSVRDARLRIYDRE